jgi:hypothetical protein
MPTDVFGDLQEWGCVLNRLDDLRKAGVLDDHQSGLARLIRYQHNWRVQQEALLAAACVSRPVEPLIHATAKVLDDREAILENRILAARALGSLLSCLQSGEDGLTCEAGSAALVMKAVLADGGPPILQRAVEAACKKAGFLPQTVE